MKTDRFRNIVKNRTSVRFGDEMQTVFIGAVVVFFLITSFPVFLFAASLDFGWGTPIILNENGENPYLAWPLQISNSTRKRWFAQIDVVAVTDTGKQYAALSDLPMEVAGDVLTLSVLKSNIFPAVTRRAVAVFKGIDLNATMVHFYVGGIVGVTPHDSEEVKYFRITYKKSLSGWKWDGSSVLE